MFCFLISNAKSHRIDFLGITNSTNEKTTNGSNNFSSDARGNKTITFRDYPTSCNLLLVSPYKSSYRIYVLFPCHKKFPTWCIIPPEVFRVYNSPYCGKNICVPYVYVYLWRICSCGKRFAIFLRGDFSNGDVIYLTR